MFGAVAIVLPVLLIPSLSWSQQKPKTFWTGPSDGFTINWTSKNLQAKSTSNQPVFDARRLASDRWTVLNKEAEAAGKDRPPAPAGDLGHSVTIDYTLVSVVGSVMTVSNEEYCECGGAHPSDSIEFQAIDLKKSAAGKVTYASLADYFPPASIYSALMADKVVQTVLGDAARPKDLTALVGALSNSMYTYPKDGCSFAFGENPLTNFAFYDYREGKAAVRISLACLVEVCRDDHIQLGIELPVPEGPLRKALSEAKVRKQGFLMKEAKTIFVAKGADEVETSFSFPEDSPKK